MHWVFQDLGSTDALYLFVDVTQESNFLLNPIHPRHLTVRTYVLVLLCYLELLPVATVVASNYRQSMSSLLQQEYSTRSYIYTQLTLANRVPVATGSSSIQFNFAKPTDQSKNTRTPVRTSCVDSKSRLRRNHDHAIPNSGPHNHRESTTGRPTGRPVQISKYCHRSFSLIFDKYGEETAPKMAVNLMRITVPCS